MVLFWLFVGLLWLFIWAEIIIKKQNQPKNGKKTNKKK